MIERARCEAAFRAAIVACDPAPHVAAAIARLGLRPTVALAIGKAAYAMARGVGVTHRGLAIAPFPPAAHLPSGWRTLVSAHPVPDDRSLAAGDAAIELMRSARRDDVVVALVSGGASALIERPAEGVTLDRLTSEVAMLVAAGAPIDVVNAARIARSAIKGGKLARLCTAPIVTLAVSDVIGDSIDVIGSAPTVAHRAGDHAEVILPIRAFAEAIVAALPGASLRSDPAVGDVVDVARALAATSGICVAWGEPTVQVHAGHGEGGRAQQLALELARQLRDTSRAAFVAGSDGTDGPPPQSRPTPAGGYVDGGTWDAIAAAGIDPAVALARRDAGTALAAVGALILTGPTGINHADVVVIG